MGEYEPKQIPGGGEYSSGWSHIEIKNSFGGLDTANASDAAGKFTDSATEFDQGIETFARSVTSSIAEAWEGEAAEAAKDAIKRYTDDARQLPNLLSDLSNQINEAAKAIVDTRNAIPDYADHSWTANIFPWRAHEEERSRNEVEQKARDAMHNNYVLRFSDFDGKVPVLPPAVNPAAPPTDPAVVPGTMVDGPGPGVVATDGNSPGAPGSEVSEGQDDTDAAESAEGNPDDQLAGQNTQPQGTQPASTPSQPAGAPNTPTPQQTTTASTTNPGVPLGPGPGPGGPQAPAPGRSLPGTPGVPSAGSPANPAAAATAARAGMPGMMGPGAAPSKGGKDEGAEHKTPDYLVNRENTDELLGEIPKTVPGGVIGGAPPASDQPPSS